MYYVNRIKCIISKSTWLLSRYLRHNNNNNNNNTVQFLCIAHNTEVPKRLKHKKHTLNTNKNYDEERRFLDGLYS